MSRDLLFLLPSGFYDNKRWEYCPECAEIWGVLAYYPSIKEGLDIHFQPIDKPRHDLVERLGDKNQNCPTLILAKDSPVVENCGIMKKSGYNFINNSRDIGLYWAARYGTAHPRGHAR